MPYLTWLDQPDCQKVSLTGGKAANLSKLAARYPVPPGFCLTTQAYSRWSNAESGVADLRELLATAYAGLAERTHAALPRVAVRSSAVGEDSHDASFAGQYETFLNVMGVKALTEAVLRCWALVQSERVVVYQQRQKGVVDNRLAVLVQAQVAADSSFVAFSADPISGDRGQVVINANWGLGESVVSGLATPDAYTIDKSSGALLAQRLGGKERMTVAGADGVQTVNVPRFLQARPALNPEQLAAVAGLAMRLEDEMGWPVDVEGAFQGETLYLLQCRPISTLG